MHHQRVAFASGFAVFCKLTGPDQTNKMKRLDTVGSNSGVCAGQVPQLWGSTNPWQNISIDDPRWSWGGASSDGWSVASYQRCISVCVPQGEHYWSCPELCGRILPCRVAALPIFQGQRAGWRSRTRTQTQLDLIGTRDIDIVTHYIAHSLSHNEHSFKGLPYTVTGTIDWDNSSNSFLDCLYCTD